MMRSHYLNILLGLGLGTFFGTELGHYSSFSLSGKAWSSIEKIEDMQKRKPTALPPAKNSDAIISKNQSFNKDLVLSDHQNKISEEFKVPSELRDRVGFWFDIYTKYSAQEEVIHHADYPWVVFRVVDLKPILEEKGNRWVKYHKSVKFSKKQKQDVKNILTRLSKKKNFKNLKPSEKEIFDALSKIPGKNRKAIIRTAIKSIRTQVGQKDFIEKGLESSSLYMPELEKVFTEKNLPLELTRLPFVESSFNVHAVSKVGASGIWQVMPYIGKKLLVMNHAIDERNSPVKAAESAAFILKQNKKILKNWPLALTAYNHGVGNLGTAVKKTGSRDLKYLIKNYRSKHFGFASQNFYASFIAVLHAEKYRSNIYDHIAPLKPLEFGELKLTKSIRLKKLLRMTGMSSEEFQKYNLDIKKEAFTKNMLIPRGYVAHIPADILGEVAAKSQRYAKLVGESEKNPKL